MHAHFFNYNRNLFYNTPQFLCRQLLWQKLVNQRQKCENVVCHVIGHCWLCKIHEQENHIIWSSADVRIISFWVGIFLGFRDSVNIWAEINCTTFVFLQKDQWHMISPPTLACRAFVCSVWCASNQATVYVNRQQIH